MVCRRGSVALGQGAKVKLRLIDLVAGADQSYFGNEAVEEGFADDAGLDETLGEPGALEKPSHRILNATQAQVLKFVRLAAQLYVSPSLGVILPMGVHVVSHIGVHFIGSQESLCQKVT